MELRGTARPKLRTNLQVRPNAFQTWGQFLYRTSTILDMQNTAFVVPVYEGPGLEEAGFFTVLPDQCEVVEAGGEPWLRYRFSSGQTAAVELANCGIVTKFQYRDDLFGEDNKALSDTMELVNLQSQAIAEAVKNSASYRFMARMTNLVKAEDLKKERERFTAQNLQDEAAGGVLLFPNTYSDIQQIQSKAYTVSEAEGAEIRRNCYNYFGVNEDVLQNKCFGDAWDAFYEGATEPFAIQLSDVITAMMFSDREIRSGNQFLLTSNRLQFASAGDKLKISQTMADRGIFNRDEIRAMWNMPPLPNGAGQYYTIRGEYYLLAEDGTIRSREGKEPPPDPIEETDEEEEKDAQ